MELHPNATVNALRVMAELITNKGYTVYPEYEGEIGIDVHEAAGLAADLVGRYADELEAAFAGWLLLRGELVGMTNPPASGDALVGRWERANTARTGDQVAAELTEIGRAHV